LSKEHCGGWI